MKKLIFTCKTITPLAMNGPYGNDPDIRPPGIKASLRFWWRALHGHLPLEQLRENEGKRFGNTQERSKVLIKVDQAFNKEGIIGETPLLPHKGNSSHKDPSLIEGLTFKVIIHYDEAVIKTDEMKNLFVISCTLGGWGKRSRRGFGSVVVTEIDGIQYNPPTNIKDIERGINSIVPNKYEIEKSYLKSICINERTSDEYPKLWKVEIGTKETSLSEIGMATHTTKRENSQEYKKSIGAGGPRLASPIYVSLLSNGLPVISSLKKPEETDYKIQNSLKIKILS